MHRKHLMTRALALLMTMAAVSGCGSAVPSNSSLETTGTTAPAVEPVSQAEDPVLTTLAPQEEVPPEEQAVYEETKITPASVIYTEFSKRYEAEAVTPLAGEAKVAEDREGFMGDGYVTGIADEQDWVLNFELPEEQYYDLTLTAAADKAVRNGFAVNGVKLSEFTTSGEGKFESFTFKNLRLPAGETTVTIVPEEGGLDLDRVEITASQDIMLLDLTLEEPELSDPAAGFNAQALYQYLCGSFGKTVLLGQHDTPGTSYETQLMEAVTGRAPAIRCGDLMYSTTDEKAARDEMDEALEWAEKGGIVSFMWSWPAPGGSGEAETVYAEKTDFDLTKAMTKGSIGLLAPEDLEKLHKSGDISDECLAVIQDIDKAAEQLKLLDEQGIPVLWRPLQEASNGYYWWGTDQEAYKWLWETMYQRMTNYHSLHDLIWVWSAQNAGWYVGDGYCDVLSADVYSGTAETAPQVNTLLYLRSISKSKPAAMSECGSFPRIQQLADDRAMWSYIAKWGGSYSVEEGGKLNEKYGDQKTLALMYSNDLTTVRDELPDLKEAAEALEKEAEEKEKEAEKKEQEDEKSKTKESKEKDSRSE